MSASLPTTPHDVPEVSLRKLAERYHSHLWRAVDAERGPLPVAELARHAVAALAVQHALSERVLRTRWVTVRDALTYGATVDDVAAAMGLDVDELVVGLNNWAAGQFRENLMTRPEFDATVALVDTVEQSGGER